MQKQGFLGSWSNVAQMNIPADSAIRIGLSNFSVSSGNYRFVYETDGLMANAWVAGSFR